ncbi:hypothetical protein BDF20DRAFT_828165 [Mycotypha africana]|uniref:uncharacterized protein n=1 Tax=Mycotypha africana TaxID=64632 RepID=UPI002300BA32|nr:uncharacterized protein BDF20DRAFT_828165 [Mycotypha africana]KAI8968308.1 hypothetical protein BDF20DRAFT_828165 [Mycotypha africana]
MSPSTRSSNDKVNGANIKSVCVFCGAGDGADPVFEQEAIGGGSVGLMGTVAKAALDNGGKITAVVPEPLFKHGSKQLCDPIVVPDMHSRKRRMYDESDAFVVLPGGFGTMEEMLEMITWSQLNIHTKPIILVNTKNYYTPFAEWVKMCVKENFIKTHNAEIFVLCESSKDVIDTLKNYTAPKARYEFQWTNFEKESLV